MSTERISQLEAFLSEDPRDTFVLFALAQEHMSAGNLVQSRTYYHQLRDVDPDYVGLYYHLGKLEESADNPGEAELVYRQGMEVAKRTGNSHAFSELQGALEALPG